MCRCTALFKAAINGRVEIVQALIRAKSLIDCPDESGLTPLMAGAMASQYGTVKALVQAGADTSLRDNNDDSAAELCDQKLPPWPLSLHPSAPLPSTPLPLCPLPSALYPSAPPLCSLS